MAALYHSHVAAQRVDGSGARSAQPVESAIDGHGHSTPALSDDGGGDDHHFRSGTGSPEAQQQDVGVKPWSSPAHVRVRPTSPVGSVDGDGGDDRNTDSGDASGGGGGDDDPGSVAPGDSGSDFTGDLSRPLPFEFRVLEAALETVCGRLESDVADVEAETAPALEALTQNVTKTTTEAVKRARAHLTRVLARCADVRAELQRILDDDCDMRDMHLSR
jgi:hypothetical protein